LTEFLDLVRELTKREMEVLAVVWVNRTGSALDVAEALCVSDHVRVLVEEVADPPKVGGAVGAGQDEVGSLAVHAVVLATHLLEEAEGAVLVRSSHPE
jgi:hypothetical protein